MPATAFKLYHPDDPACRTWPRWYFWSFVYMDGEGERVFADAVAGIHDPSAPDLIASDSPRPEAAGEYQATAYGHPVVIVMAERHGHLCGRACLASDAESLAMCRNPARWG